MIDKTLDILDRNLKRHDTTISHSLASERDTLSGVLTRQKIPGKLPFPVSKRVEVSRDSHATAQYSRIQSTKVSERPFEGNWLSPQSASVKAVIRPRGGIRRMRDSATVLRRGVVLESVPHERMDHRLFSDSLS
jgi:hypothetical protein